MPIDFYIGETGMGKTTKAEIDATSIAEENGAPVVLLDYEGVLQLQDAIRFEHAPRPWYRKKDKEAQASYDAAEDEIFERMHRAIWEEGKHVIYHPLGDDDAGRFLLMVKGGGKVSLVIDEASYCARGNQALDEVLQLARANRLAGVDVFCTTQYPSDLHPLMWNVKRNVYVFRCPGEGALDFLQEELAFDDEIRERIKTMPDMEFLKFMPRKSPST